MDGVGSEALVERLEARRAEIEQAIWARVRAMDETGAVEDPEYAHGLKAAVYAGLSCGLAVLRNPDASPQVLLPPELVSQVHRAANSGVGLHTVLRRYVAGHALLSDFISQESTAIGSEGRAFERGAFRAEAALLDWLIEAIAREYNCAVEARFRSRDHRRIECVRKLLAGELTDAAELRYDLSTWHVGVVARGVGAEGALRVLAEELRSRPLVVTGSDGALWAWLGFARSPDLDRVCRLATVNRPQGAAFAIGEPERNVEGWRLTHRQALATMPIALRDASGIVCHGDVALLAAALRDDVLAESLRRTYLLPLEAADDGGRVLRGTLRACIAAAWNVSSAAVALGVSRQTVRKRVCSAEERIGRPLRACTAEIETALRLHRWDHNPYRVDN